MLIKCIFLLSLSLQINAKRFKKLFDLNADDIVESEIGDVYEARALLNRITYGPPADTTTADTSRKNGQKNYKNSAHRTRPPPPTFFNVTKDKIIMATVSPDIKLSKNITVEDIKMRRMKRTLERILSDDFKAITDFTSDAHDPEEITRRFNELIQKGKKTESRRAQYEYETIDIVKYRYHQKVRVWALMEQLIYETRYKLVISQILRNKYINNYSYKLGYAFALLRHVKNMQKWIWWSLSTLVYYVNTHYFHLKILEKVVCLDVDIKNIIKLIRRLDYERKMEHNPKYYDYSMEVKPTKDWKFGSKYTPKPPN